MGAGEAFGSIKKVNKEWKLIDLLWINLKEKKNILVNVVTD